MGGSGAKVGAYDFPVRSIVRIIKMGATMNQKIIVINHISANYKDYLETKTMYPIV